MVYVGPALVLNQVAYATLLTLVIWSYPYVSQYQHMAQDMDRLDLDFNQMFYSNGSVTPFPGPNKEPYAWAYLDLTNTIVELNTPDTRHLDIWYSITLTSVSTEIINKRIPGEDKNQKAKSYYLVGPNFQNENLIVPSGYKVIKCPDNIIWLVVRTVINNGDLNASFNLIQQITITPLIANADTLEITPFSNAIYSSMDYFTMVSNILEYNPPQDLDLLMDRFATKNVDFKLPFSPPAPNTPIGDAYMAALNYTINNFLPFGYQWGTGLVTASNENGTTYWSAPTALARWGTDYERRAYAISVNTLAPNVVEEQMYATVTKDLSGANLNGALHNYTFHLEADEIPKVNANFGKITITMYNYPVLDFVSNPLNIYGLNFDDLYVNPDGSIDIHMSYAIPTDTTNYLPAPNGPFTVYMRMYLAAPVTISNFYLPGIVITDN